MTKEEVEKVLQQIKPTMITPNGSLELVELADKKIKLKVTGLPTDIFKVQGKIVRTDEEIKKKIAARLESSFEGVKVEFV